MKPLTKIDIIANALIDLTDKTATFVTFHFVNLYYTPEGHSAPSSTVIPLYCIPDECVDLVKKEKTYLYENLVDVTNIEGPPILKLNVDELNDNGLDRLICGLTAKKLELI